MRGLPAEIAIFAALLLGVGVSSAHAEGEVDVCPGLRKIYEELALHGDPNRFQLGLGARFKAKIEAFRGLAKALEVSEGDLERLISKSGANYTAEDVEIIRKYTRLLGVINRYAETRLYIAALTEDNRAAYQELNKAMAGEKATLGFAEGKSDAKFLADARRAKAKELNLALNDVVFEADARMGEAIETCKRLGGEIVDGKLEEGQLSVWRQDLVKNEKILDDILVNLEKDRAQLDELKLQQSQAGSDTAAEAIGKQIKEAEKALVKRDADRLLFAKRTSDLSKKIEKGSADFIQSYDLLDLAEGLPQAKLNSDTVKAVELPYEMMGTEQKALFVPTPGEKQAWKTVAEFEGGYSATERVRRELGLTLDVRKTNLKRIIRGLNEMTGKVYGVKFTETEIGKQWAEYANSWLKDAENTARRHWIKVLIGTGSSVAVGLVRYEIDELTGKKATKKPPDEKPEEKKSGKESVKKSEE